MTSLSPKANTSPNLIKFRDQVFGFGLSIILVLTTSYLGLYKEDLRSTATDLWQTIVRLETEKYDLQERQKRQDYDVSSSQSFLVFRNNILSSSTIASRLYCQSHFKYKQDEVLIGSDYLSLIVMLLLEDMMKIECSRPRQTCAPSPHTHTGRT